MLRMVRGSLLLMRDAGGSREKENGRIGRERKSKVNILLHIGEWAYSLFMRLFPGEN